MKDKNKLKVGDKVDLFLGRPPYYRTVIDDIVDEETVSTPIPTYRGITIILREGQELQLFYYRPKGGGRFCVDARVGGLHIDGDMKRVELELLSPPRKEQRRLSYRVPANIKTVVCFSSDGDPAIDVQAFTGSVKESAYTRDISETGVAIVMEKSCGLGERVLLELYLPLPTERELPLRITAEVRREAYDEIRKTYQVGLQFLAPGERIRMELAKYILTRQQMLLKQERLVEGN